MRIVVDGDACPDKKKIATIAHEHKIDMYVFCDYAHLLDEDDYHVVTCEIGHDSVDMAILRFVEEHDIVITQDYGLAGLLLLKKVCVLHTSGKIIDKDNIENLLSTRYMSAKMRRAGQRTKGPAKRTTTDTTYLLEQLHKVIKQQTP